MKMLSNLGLVLTLLTLSAFAHDGAHGMKGTVTAVTDSAIVIETLAKKTESIHFDAKTIFTKSGVAASAKDLKVGDRVAIEAHDMDGKMHAVKVRFGKPAKNASTPKSEQKVDHATHSPEKK